ncbi:MAG: hypothetical protein ONA69_00395 [candidate division KSB1 bacterium]|nr:hypothetical protein [candidate division KSB1 bacterium]MDZ7345231.1 hypothetical protein [candidate division KSB1 bacterium]
MLGKSLRKKIQNSSKTGKWVAGAILAVMAISLGTVLVLNMLKPEKETADPEDSQHQ